MGVNELWLYMEDVYKIEEYPMFGYKRGAYSKEELEEVVKYAEIFEVKIVPAIQTLGHMEQFLRWSNTRKFSDQKNVLLSGEKDTYNLIDSMFKTLKSIFNHEKIHIGLDETWGLGFGNYYKKNGYKPQIDIFFEHLEIVNELAKKNGFKDVLIWSDMSYRILSKTGSYYDHDIKLDKNIIDKLPENIRLVYWDYYHKEFNKVNQMLESHIKISENIIFASGTWIWTRFTYDKNETDKTVSTHIKAATKNNINEFILTQWMEDGAYGDHETTLLGVYELSMKANTKNTISVETYEFIMNESIEFAYNRAKLNELEMSQVGLMWDDHQFSLYLANFVKNDLKNYDKHLKEMKELLDIYSNKKEYDFEKYILLSNYYKVLGKYNLVKEYQSNNEILDDKYFKIQVTTLEKLNDIYSNLWYKNYKMNGLEIIQSRLGGQILRAKQMIKIIGLYNNKEIDKIDGILDEVKIMDESLSLKYANIAYTTLMI